MTVKGSCHCGATTFEAAAAPETVTSCTCTFCSKRGALWAYYKPEDVTLSKKDEDATYRWRTKSVAHHFCARCGCTTYTVSPDFSSGKADFDNPRFAINARLLDDFALDKVPVTVIDGRNLW